MRFLFILLVSSICYAQPKGANVIKVTGVSFKQVAQALVDNGFFFEKIDSNYQVIKTDYKEVKGYVMTIQLEVRIKDSTATLKGTWISSNYKFDIENQKSAAPYRITFKALNDFALSFNKPVEYIKE